MSSFVEVLELVGESKQGFEDAVRKAVEQASKKYPNVTGVEVYNFTGDVVDGNIVDYKANVKVVCIH